MFSFLLLVPSQPFGGDCGDVDGGGEGVIGMDMVVMAVVVVMPSVVVVVAGG